MKNTKQHVSFKIVQSYCDTSQAGGFQAHAGMCCKDETQLLSSIDGPLCRCSYMPAFGSVMRYKRLLFFALSLDFDAKALQCHREHSFCNISLCSNIEKVPLRIGLVSFPPNAIGKSAREKKREERKMNEGNSRFFLLLAHWRQTKESARRESKWAG